MCVCVCVSLLELGQLSTSKGVATLYDPVQAPDPSDYFKMINHEGRIGIPVKSAQCLGGHRYD